MLAAAILKDLQTRSLKPTLQAEDSLQAACGAVATAAALSTYLSNYPSEARSCDNREVAKEHMVEASSWLTGDPALFDSEHSQNAKKVAAPVPKPSGLTSGDESLDDVSASDVWGRHTTAGSLISKSQADFSGSGSSSDGEQEEEESPARYFMSSLPNLPYRQCGEALEPYHDHFQSLTMSLALSEAMAVAGPSHHFPWVPMIPTSMPPKPTKHFCPWCGGKRQESFLFCPSCGGSLS
eukprot:TRINITY_DN107843_c0_g1_i1.p1 TRINITY_DN107843_c0_g1~~TRINITY_DN107843_c0_g1_i1.p1  ORF type:complete len:238 (-),score=49.53 TRINITY_DN107843_c0_g1_i1:232-945(-)